VLAFGSSLVWYVAEIAAGYPYLHPSIPIWNAFVRLVFFVIIALLLSALRNRFIAEMRLAKTDALTGLSNSRAFREQLDHDLALMARSGDPLSLVYIDLDDFKSINDSYGHGAGDELLRHVADKLVESTRRSDTVARLGGDEFALILPATNLDGALSLTRKLEQVFQPLGEKGRAVTCSIGAVVFDQRQPTADEAVAAADRLMYAAKSGGKNRRVVRCYSELAPEPTAVPLDMSAAQVSANPAIAGR
jgi:diguanylate cyclase (GGDEF)-like protein